MPETETNDAALANLEDLYPLSPMQQGMLFHSIYAPGSGVYIEQSVFTLTGEFDVAVFERAWQKVVDRHAILRTAFLWEDLENPVQAVGRQVDLPIARHDWRDHEDCDRRLQSFLAEDRRRGFLLSEAPLMRIALIRFAEREYRCVLSRHHMVLDRWSRALVLKDFVAIYDALAAGREPALPAPRPYGEYIAWLGRQDSVAAERFWRTSLADFTERTDLGVDAKTPRPVESAAQYADLRTRLSEADTQKLQAFARQHRLTLNTVAQAAWALLLARYSGTDDVVFGVSTAGRPADLPGVESIVGLLINTLPLRVRVAWGSPLRSWLQTVQESQTALQQFQYSSLLDIHGWSEIPRTQPLFDSIFIFENLPVATKTSGGGLQMRGDRGYGSVTNYPITVLVMPGSQLHVQIVFDVSRFDEPAIAAMLSHFVNLLRGIVADSERPVHTLSLLTTDERRQALEAWNQTEVSYDSDTPVHALFEAQVQKTPGAVAVIAAGAEQGWTYAELNGRANQLARHLRTLGVGSEVRVGVLLERSVDVIVALLGVLKAGGTYVPLDPGHPPERVRFALQDARASLVLTQTPLLPLAAAGDGTTVICLDRDSEQIAVHPRTDLERAVAGRHLAYVIYTSGSTGTPKGVQVEHRSLTNLLCSMRDEPGLTAEDVLLSVTTLSFDIAALELYLPLIAGARLVIAGHDEAADGDRLKQRLAETGATVMQATPATWRMLIDSGWTGGTLRALCGGEQLSRELADRLLTKVSALWNLYGPTETTIWSATQRVASAPGPVTMGRPIANTQLYVLDSHLEPAPVGVAGELHIGGDGLARGYWGHPELTAEKFLPNPFATRPGERLYRTGDRARVQLDGTIEWLGRLDHQVKLRGFRIELGEIESALRSHPAISEAVAVVRDDIPGDPRLVAYLVGNDGHTSPSLVADLRAIVAHRLPRYMMPSAFVVLDAWPLTGNGKINRRALPAPDGARPELDLDYAQPLAGAEEVLASIWAEVLKVETVGRHDNFFQLGGHSLRAVQVISRVREQFALELPLRWLFEHPTVAELASAITTFDSASGRPATTIAKDIDQDAARPRPVSFAQQRLWFLSRLEPDSAAYNMPRPLRLRGPLDVPALHQAFNTILERHEVLRGSFDLVDGQPVQVIAPRLEIDLPVVSLEPLPAAEREAEVTRLALADVQRPFDLMQVPLLRASLLRLGPDEHVLLLNMHHIVSDGWSMGILLRELGAAYEAAVAARPADLPALPIQYADFARWQRGWLQGSTLDAELGYWRQQLAGVPPVFDLPVARPRPAMQTMRGALVSSLLSPRLSGALRDLSAREGVTLFMTLLAAFQTLLYRYSGQEDFVVGSPIAGRDRAETEGLIGFFVNSLPLRANLAGNPRFRELLARVKETALAAYAHQVLPFERMVEELQPARSLSYPPIFQVMFALQNQPAAPITLPGISISPLGQTRDSAKFDLTLFTAESEGRLSCRLEYNTDLFDEATVTRLLEHFEVLLEGVVARPQERVADLPLLREAERQQVLTTWNATHEPWPEGACVHQLIEQQVERDGDATAVVVDGQATSYAELNRRANQLAHHLRTLGVGPEVLVGIFMDRSAEMLVALLAVLKAGGAYVPLDPEYPPDRVRFSLQDAQVAVVLTQDSLASRLPASQARVVFVDRDRDAIGQERTTNPNLSATAANLAYVIYTSGSTGQPKGVAIAHRSTVALVAWAQRTFTREELAGVLASTSICFDLSVFELFVPWSVGGAVILAQDALHLPAVAASASAIAPVTLINTVPSAMAALLRGGALPATVRTVNLAGEPLRTELVAEIYRQPSVRRVVDLYGPSEDTTYSTVAERQPDAPATIGRPIANTRVYILDRTLAPVPIGVPGEIHLGGAGLARGYLARAAGTAERFIPDPFSGDAGARLYRTGDLGRYAPDGSIEYLGRLDHQVKIRGYRIELGEIETALGRHPGVRDTLVVAREDAPDDKRLVAYIVPGANAQSGESRERVQSGYLAQWQTIWDDTYAEEATANDPTFDISGWNSSYTGAPMPDAEMSDWVERTVARITSLKPQHVLEIGCGTGLLLFRVAPGVETYHGTEISATALDRLQAAVSATPDRYRNVVLSRRMAHDLSGLAPQSYDTVILNSVVQYFPNVDYLVRVLEGAIALVKPGGSIFLGDLRNLRLLEAFHASVELHAARSSMRTSELRRRIQRGVRREKELAIDPALFSALRSHLPGIARVEVQLKRGRYSNELSKFRYDVILHVGGEPIATGEGQWQWWQKDFFTLDALSQMVRENAPDVMGVAGLVNARVAEDVEAMKMIASDGAPATAGQLRNTLEEGSTAATVEPEDLFVLAEQLGYAAEVRWGTGSAAETLELILHRLDMASVDLGGSDGTRTALGTDESWARYGNNPLHAELARRLVAELRQTLTAQLPDYMMPSAFVVLDALPLTANGKIHRQALPAPDDSARERDTEYVEPRSRTEVALAAIWGEVLNLQQIGLHDDFFQLGGHSLLATLVISRVRERLRTELPLRDLFEYPTLVGLAAAIDAAHSPAEPLAASGITRGDDAAAGDLLANLDQLTDAEIEMLLREASADDLRS